MKGISRLEVPLVIALCVLAISCGDQQSQPPPTQAGDAPEILWDRYGVPHIFSPHLDGAFYAFGWAQMEAHGDLILELYGQARGTAAKYWGEQYFDNDQRMARMNTAAVAAAWWQQQDQASQAALNAFVQGVNEYAATYPNKLDRDMSKVLPVKSEDIMAHFFRTIHLTFIANDGEESFASSKLQKGSNAWAIAPARSASGNALLLGNPHLLWDDVFLFFEAHITTADMEIYGASLIGHPLIGLGFNRHLGWSHTVNTHDGVDFFELTLVDENTYQWGDETKTFEITEHQIEVLQDDGTTKKEMLRVKRSECGPVIAESNGKAIAEKMVGLDRAHVWQQYLDMARSKNLSDFQKAQSKMQMPMFNTIYADRDGHIMHFFGGDTPKRPDGDWNKWQDVVPAGPENHWTEVHAYSELPRVVDPPSGWLQNANDPPWTTTFPRAIDPDAYPAYIAPRHMSFRAQSSARMLAEDESITFEELLAYKHDTRMLTAERLMDDLAGAVAKHGDQEARDALAVLHAWDGRTDAESKGAILFHSFFDRLRRQGNVYAEPWSPEQPRTTPDGLKDPKAAVETFVEAADAVLEEHGRLDVPWGDIYRFRVDDVDLPANGGSGRYGIFRVIGFRPDEDGKRRATAGDSFVFAVEFSDPVKAQVVMSYGNASQPDSPHRTDQLALIAAQKMRPALMDRDAIEANLKRKVVLD